MVPESSEHPAVDDSFMRRRQEQMQPLGQRVPQGYAQRSPLADLQLPAHAAALKKAGWICKTTARGLNIWCKPNEYDWYSQANAYHLLTDARYKQRLRR